MYVEFEKVEEGVGNHGDCAIELCVSVNFGSEEQWGNVPASTP